ncbi:acyl-CoA carboxylase subunit beta [Oceanibacterium hippocampi]|uniref:Methylmalonyl-CoA carboxyltransferase 12S subunit n=1 Tax=Oceanibacterium hippocampi TaxID=745714 RepID=A0A1Y5TB37_9PROT|nr:carboxyl transferase domain-containing protein [Oceanibacterium hippocampi]SLN59581.1 Methylmalonyl-CoA carboxyltransferase 12S subunit [Oceanibacterium hippocampi]
MDHDEALADYERRKARALAMGSPKRLAERRAAGILNARERLARLVDPGTFTELGLFAHSSRMSDAGKTPADGIIEGFGEIDGRIAAVSASDFTTMGASSAMVAGKKQAHLARLAVENGTPIVFLGECSGARMPDTMGAAGPDGHGGIGGIATKGHYMRRRKVPWIAAVLGQSYGGSTWNAAMSDFVVMRKGAVMAVSSVRVTEVAIAEAIDEQELGGWRMQTAVTGQVDMAVDNDEEALAALKAYLGYLPGHAGELPPTVAVPAGSDDAAASILDIVPAERVKTYDIRRAIQAIVDRDSYFPLKERFGKSIVTALCRLGGQSVGMIATNPIAKGGALDPDACDKAASFITLCDSFNIPLVLLTDTPGFLIGVEGERRRMPGKIMNFLQALELATVPKLGIILRKSYGQAYINMGGGRVDVLAAWPGAEIGFMDPAVGVNVVHGVRQADDPARFAELVSELARGTSAYDLAGPYLAHAVIDPRESRDWLIRMLKILARRPNGGIGEHLLANWPTTL